MNILRLIFVQHLLLINIFVCNVKPISIEVKQLRWIKKANPIVDANKALSRKDYTLLGVHGYTWSIPGIQDSQKFAYREKFGLKLIEGTGDVVLNSEHSNLIEYAREYAKQYNLYVLGHINDK